MKPQSRLLAVGECMVELAPTADGKYERNFAGDTFNTAYYSRCYLPKSWTVDYFSAVGDDEISAAMLAFIGAQGIGVSQVSRVAGRSVGLYMIELRNGERRFSYWRSHSAAKTLANNSSCLRQAFTGADAIFFSGITLAILETVALPGFLGELERARGEGKTVAFDPNIRPRLWPDAEVMRKTITKAGAIAQVILPSFDDEAMAFGDVSPAATVRRYRALGAQAIVVKNGAKPLLVDASGRSLELPAEPVKQVVDATAAGDSFNGAFLASFLTSGDAEAAARLGSRVAATVIGHRGALVAQSLLPK